MYLASWASINTSQTCVSQTAGGWWEWGMESNTFQQAEA